MFQTGRLEIDVKEELYSKTHKEVRAQSTHVLWGKKKEILLLRLTASRGM